MRAAAWLADACTARNHVAGPNYAVGQQIVWFPQGLLDFQEAYMQDLLRLQIKDVVTPCPSCSRPIARALSCTPPTPPASPYSVSLAPFFSCKRLCPRCVSPTQTAS